MQRGRPAPKGWQDGLGLALITALVLGTVSLAYMPVEGPIIDDWTYAWSVKHLLEAGDLRMLEWSAHYPLAQIAWAALFSHVFGFSFVVLRLSTLVLAWAGLVAFFLTLRELGIHPLLAGLGTLTLWCNPVFFVLSHSFMTDVPFLSAMNTALLFYVRWFNRGRTADLALGSVSTTLAFLIRQPGAVLALIPLGCLLLARVNSREHRPLPWLQWVCLLAPFLGVGLTLWWIKAVHGETRVYIEKARNLHLLLAISGWTYVRELLHVLLHLGLVLWPIAWTAFGRLSRRTLVSAVGAVMVLSGLVLWREGVLPDPLGEMLTRDELGLSYALISKHPSPRPLPFWARTAVLGISLGGAVAILAALWAALGQWLRCGRASATVPLLNTLLQSLLLGVLWLFYDRYYLPLLPGVTALLVATIRPTRTVMTIGTAGVLLWGTIAVTGTIDQFRCSQAIADARAWLLGQGVAAEHIDAGYPLNGWWLYALARNGPPRRGREPDVPWVTGWTLFPYRIANAVEPPYAVIRSFHWRAIWATSDTLYVLEHSAVTEQWGLSSLRGRGQQTP
jgi:hypothetical protein